MAEHIFFNGKKYFKTNKHYWRCTNQEGKYLHVAIWESVNGKVPEGYEIHHVDLNPENNALKNLQCLSKSEHSHLHRKLNPPKTRERKRTKVCAHCGKSFLASRKDARFCSKNCQVKQRYWQGLCHTKRICVWCGKEFLAVNVYTQHCSKECTLLHRMSQKLSSEIREEIRRVYKKGDKEFGARPLAKKYGVHHKTIWSIVNEK